MNKPTIVLSLAAGLLGGTLSRYLTPAPVLAQAPPPVVAPRLPLAPPAGMQTLKLPVALVDQAGYTVGTIAMDGDGLPNIRLFDNSSRSTKGGLREIWSARGNTFRPATSQ